MKRTLALLFIVFTTHSFSQDSISTSTESDLVSVDLMYGQCLVKTNWNNQLNTTSQYSFTHPIQTLGIGISVGYMRNQRHDYAIQFSYAQVVPQQITLFDTLSSNINGFILSVNLFGRDLTPRSKIISCVVGFGFNTGRFRISGNEYKQQKNPFFSPALFIQPKLMLGPIALSLGANYSYDVSKGNWRSLNFTTKTKRFDLEPFKQTGLMLYFSIGWMLGDR